MKTCGLLLFLWCFTAPQLMSQSTKSFAEIDSSTYALYMNGEWSELLSEGRSAMASGIDYYYLRMRMAYAYFITNNYRAAIPHYEKALQFNNNDIALSYLLQCYEYGGRYNDALIRSKHLNHSQYPALKKKYNRGVVTLALFYTYNQGQTNTVKTNISDGLIPTIDGLQKITNYFHTTSGLISHRIGKTMLLNHTLNYLYKNEDAFWLDNQSVYEIIGQSVHQWNYNGQLQFTPFKGTRIIPSINYTQLSIPSSNQLSNSYTESYTFYSAKIQQDLKMIQLGISYAYGQANGAQQEQYGGHFTWYPKGNLNLYYSLDGYYQKQSAENQEESKFIHKHLLGFKVNKSWWIEASGLFPNFGNLYDINDGVLYNSIEQSQNILNLRNYILSKDMNTTYVLSLGYFTSISGQLKNLNMLQQYNQHTYTNLMFSGGIIWKL